MCPSLTCLLLVAIYCMNRVTCLSGYTGEARDYVFTWSSMSEKSDLQQGIRNKLDIPDQVNARVAIDRMNDLRLTLTRQRFLSVPPITVTSSDGTSFSTKRNDNEETYFYTDRDGQGSVACQLRKDTTSGKYFCSMIGLFSIGRLSCYIGPGRTKADCTTKVLGRRECHRNWTDTDTGLSVDGSVVQAEAAGNTTVNTRASLPLPRPGYKTLELILVADAKFMKVFYDLNSRDPTAGRQEAAMYLTLLVNEINVFYDSLREHTRGEFVLFVYPTRIIVPKISTNFHWSSKYNNGRVLHASQEMDGVLRTFVKTVLKSRPADHVMAFTGYRLQSDTGNILGYAYSNTVCTSVSWKYSLIQFRDIDPSATAAHELGHALGARHDEDVGCPSATNVMSASAFFPSSATRHSYYRFSGCSLKDIKSHLKKFPSCTTDNSFTDRQFRRAFCAGYLGSQHAALDTQCQKQTGYSGSRACDSVDSDVECYLPGRIRCRNKTGKCASKLSYVWNGTPCGQNKMCFKGRCARNVEVCPA